MMSEPSGTNLETLLHNMKDLHDISKTVLHELTKRNMKLTVGFRNCQQCQMGFGEIKKENVAKEN